MTPNLSDSELAAGAVAGDEAALAELIRRYLPSIYSYLARMTDNDTAADLAQEAFVKAWKHLKRFDQRQNFKPWIYAIARNCALDHLRKKRPAAFSSFENAEGNNPLADSLADAEDLPDELAKKAEQKGVLAEALLKIPLLYRSVLILRYDEGLEFEEISKALRRPLETVRSQHRRGIGLLRECLKDSDL